MDPTERGDARSRTLTHSRISWTPDLALGVDVVDEQHKELFVQIDRVLSSMAAGQANSAVARLMSFLETYVLLHFGTEERLMKRSAYPGFEGHRAEHVKFMADFAEIKARFDAEGHSPDLASAVSSRICDWLIAHIHKVDRAYAVFLRKKDATPPSEFDRPAHTTVDMVSPLAWTDDLSVGVALIDEQHQEIFRRVNRLLSAARNGVGRVEVAATLDFLSSYVVEHFDAEERLMRSVAYPDYEIHRAQHEGLKKEAARFKLALSESGATVSLVMDVNRIVCAWLTNHIRKSDKALGEYMSRRASPRRSDKG